MTKENRDIMIKLLKKCIPPKLRSLFRIIKNSIRIRYKIKFGVDLVKHCNLNCKGCDHFSCIADKEFAKYESVMSDMRQMRKIFNNRVRQITFLGGEPLLNEEIEDYCTETRKIFPNTKIVILTNGTLTFKMKQSFWDCCKHNNIAINITRYPIEFDYSSAEKYIAQKGIKVEHMAKSDKIVKTMYCLPLDLEGKQNPKLSYRLCWKGNNCITLEKGRLYTCTLVPNIDIFNREFDRKIDVQAEDYIDIYENTNADEILKRLHRPIPFCRYCDVKNTRNGIPWETTKREINEWI